MAIWLFGSNSKHFLHVSLNILLLGIFFAFHMHTFIATRQPVPMGSAGTSLASQKYFVCASTQNYKQCLERLLESVQTTSLKTKRLTTGTGNEEPRHFSCVLRHLPRLIQRSRVVLFFLWTDCDGESTPFRCQIAAQQKWRRRRRDGHKTGRTLRTFHICRRTKWWDEPCQQRKVSLVFFSCKRLEYLTQAKYRSLRKEVSSSWSEHAWCGRASNHDAGETRVLCT